MTYGKRLLQPPWSLTNSYLCFNKLRIFSHPQHPCSQLYLTNEDIGHKWTTKACKCFYRSGSWFLHKWKNPNYCTWCSKCWWDNAGYLSISSIIIRTLLWQIQIVCAIKFKPYLTKIVKSLRVSLDGYIAIVSIAFKVTNGIVDWNSNIKLWRQVGCRGRELMPSQFRLY